MSVLHVDSRLVETASILVHRPGKIVFRFIGEQFFSNYPRLSPEVEKLQIIDPGPIRVGTRACQVRIDQGRRSESDFVISEFEPNQRICLEGLTYPYRCAWEMEEINPDASTLVICSFELPHIVMESGIEGLVCTAVRAGIEHILSRLKCLVENDAAQRLPHGDFLPKPWNETSHKTHSLASVGIQSEMVV